MTGLLVLGAIALAALVRALFVRVRALEARVVELEIAEMHAIGAREPVAPPPARAIARVRESEPTADRVEVEPIAVEEDNQPAPPPPRPWDRVAEARPAPVADPEPLAEPDHEPAVPLLSRLEGVIGGRLPIWIGGAALVLAAFFLVRYSIEQGLLGPQARSIIAAIFGLALVAASEVARRLPATRDDVRIGQALAGAGIAILYGTLYMAAELYGLLGAGAAFALMVAITLAALGLSLRHGPPTALMGLIGGFAAPLVTGIDGANVAPLLIYLALFTAGLFALAIHRGWLWLALLATGGGLVWPLALLALAEPSGLPFIGLFVLTLAFAATLALPRAGTSNGLLRLAPLVVGLVQLVLIAPALSFSPLAWGLYALLGAAALWLAWRDPKLAGGAGAATGLMLALLAIGLWNDAPHAQLAALGFTLLFGGAGHALAQREPDGRAWTIIALAATVGPLLLVLAFADAPPPAASRAALASLAALGCAWLSWRHRDRAGASPRAEPGLVLGAGLAALVAEVAALQVLPDDLFGSIWFAIAIALAAWAAWLDDRWVARLAAVALALAVGPGLLEFGPLLAGSLAGDTLPYRNLPALAPVLRELALPGIVIAASMLAWPERWSAQVRTVAATVAGLALIASLYALAKQPLAINDETAFLYDGFRERAAITQALLIAGLLAAKYPALRSAAGALVALGVFRIAWFDLGVLNPLVVEQVVDGIPLLNPAVVHFALAALWLRLAASRFERSRELRLASLAATALAIGFAVRQGVQGPLINYPGITTTENYLYSAAFLALAIGWLTRGIMTGARDLRLIGLALLTLVTLKVFLIDAAALTGLLRILSFLGLGLALIAIGWAYSRFLARPAITA